MIELPDKKKCYNLPEQVAQNLRNITFLAEQYKNIDALPAIWQTYKEEFDDDIVTFGEWTNTFAGWTETLSTYLANMSSAAVGAIAGQTIAPANVAATGSVTADSIIENMSGYSFTKGSTANVTYDYVFAGVVKNGNKLTMVIAVNITKNDASVSGLDLGKFTVPAAIAAKLYPTQIGLYNFLATQKVDIFTSEASSVNVAIYTEKLSNDVRSVMTAIASLPANTKYYVRLENTFLLSDNLAV